jgi:hypothetical protein
MQRPGQTVRTEGQYRIVELIEIHLDDTREVLGYNVFGPDIDGRFLYDREAADSAVDKLSAARR